ncbi:DUF4126 domain-containing protein [Oscillatoria salina]|uniref:DUF4126 domain-containing protein n=1 Tax=Oscillatoria salina TaxID=331517 RepID=UPI0013BD53AD|nr:DUF4126 domain-containing protein [Oscillatoria salina]MBZ8181246.1 DUF4126 domain-containing protein [Oscillatoria salina IIICB1]NET90124.1 DUF4126 domain-containing protein [Kamptonema sp. SIO1D9]
METFLAICLGVSLSTACGFRVFVPPLVMSLAAIYGHLTLAPEFAWMGTYPALIAFAIATVVEIVAYYVPVLDHFLDAIAAPTAVVAGMLITASTLGTEVDPWVQWTVAAIAGGGAAGIVEILSNFTRIASTGTTGGLGNPIFATIELVTSTGLSILAIALPLLAGILVISLLCFAIIRLSILLSKLKQAQTSS